jgi:hypothetical protein
LNGSAGNGARWRHPTFPVANAQGNKSQLANSGMVMSRFRIHFAITEE